MRNVLVTGGAGFIGSNFIHFILRVEPFVQIINLDALTYAGVLENLVGLPDPSRHVFIKGNICDRSLVEEVFQEYEIDTVVHFAAETHVDRSIVDPGKFIETNVIGTFALLDVAREYWSSKKPEGERNFHFHHVSTDEVYGTLAPDEPAWTEDIPYAPNSPYAASKAASDHLVRSYYITYGLPVTITNCSNNYGPWQFPEKLIPLMINNALSGKTLPIYGDGKNVRDWLYVEDHCEAIWHVIKGGRKGETYNIGGDNQPTNIELVESICNILDEVRPESPYKPHRSLIQFVADRPGHDRRYAMDIRKIGKELGWEPKRWLDNGLEETVKWYLENQDWLNIVKSKPDYQKWVVDQYSKRGKI